MKKHEAYDVKFANKMSAAKAASNGLEILAGSLPEGSFFMHNGVAYPLHGTTVEQEHLPISGKTINVAEFPNSQIPFIVALTKNYVDFPVEAPTSGVNGRAIAMGLAALVAGGFALAAAPGHAYAVDSATGTVAVDSATGAVSVNPATGTVTLGEAMANLRVLPNNANVYGDKGKAYNLDFRVDKEGKTTSAHQIIDANNTDQMKVLTAVFGGDFARRIDGDMGNTELSYIGLTFKKYENDKVIITIKAQYGTDARAPVNEKSCNDSGVCVNVSQNNDYSLTDVRGTQLTGRINSNGELEIVESLKINNSERSALEKQAAADFVNLVYDLFGGFRAVETAYTEKPAAEKQGLNAKPAETPEKPTIESTLKIKISDKGGNPLRDNDKDGKLDTKLGNPYGITLEYTGDLAAANAIVTVEYTPLMIKKGATETVPVVTEFQEKNIESALTSSLSSMTPSATSTVATDTIQTNFATQTAFANLGVYTITAEVGGVTDAVQVYFPKFAANDNYKDIVAALAGIGILAVVFNDKGSDFTPAGQAGPTPNNPDPNTQLLGGEQTHTIKVK